MARLASQKSLQKQVDVQRVIGWLAKEGKLVIELKGRVETLSLK